MKKVIGLRVVDASALRELFRRTHSLRYHSDIHSLAYVPAAHPMGPIQALAERAADLIKAEYQGTKSVHDEL